MRQELGETTQEMIKADDAEVQRILNRRPTGHYWIVIHHKVTKMHLDSGERVIMRVVKDYDQRPRALVGTIILEVKDGEIVDHTVSPPDAPIDWGAVESAAGLKDYPAVIEKNPAAGAYLYND